jgi:hypothetical protein
VPAPAVRNRVKLRGLGSAQIPPFGNKTPKLWALGTGRCARWKATLAVSFGVAVTADGKRAVYASKANTLMVWSLDSGSPSPPSTVTRAPYAVPLPATKRSSPAMRAATCISFQL